jgi:hypothetical protein
MKLRSAVLVAAVAITSIQITTVSALNFQRRPEALTTKEATSTQDTVAAMSAEMDTSTTSPDDMRVTLPQRFDKYKRSLPVRALKFFYLGKIVQAYDFAGRCKHYATTCSRVKFTMPDRYHASYKTFKKLAKSLNDSHLLEIRTASDLDTYCIANLMQNVNSIAEFTFIMNLFFTHIQGLRNTIAAEKTYLDKLLEQRAKKYLKTDSNIIEALKALLAAYNDLDNKLVNLIKVMAKSDNFKQAQACALDTQKEKALIDAKASADARIKALQAPVAAPVPVIVNLHNQMPGGVAAAGA